MQHRRTLEHRIIFTCSVCPKTFGRKDNLDRHILRQQDGSLYKCNDCGCGFSRRDSLQRHRKAKHDQIGRGLKRPAEDDYKSSPKRRVRIENDPTKFYDLRILTTQHMSKRHRKAKHDQIGRGLKRPAEDDYKSSPK